MTVAMVVFTTIYHAMQKSSDKKLQQFAFRAILFYAGGFFVLWLPEQVLCGNQLLPDAPVSSLSELPIPLHVFPLHIGVGTVMADFFAVYKDLHQQARACRYCLLQELSKHWCSFTRSRAKDSKASVEFCANKNARNVFLKYIAFFYIWYLHPIGQLSPSRLFFFFIDFG